MITKEEIQDAVRTHRIVEVAYQLLEEREICIEVTAFNLLGLFSSETGTEVPEDSEVWEIAKNKVRDLVTEHQRILEERRK